MMFSDKHYQAFRVTVEALESIVSSLSSAPDIRALNDYERQAQQALFNLQHTSMGLAYWVQGVAQVRRREINNGDVAAEPVIVAQPEPEQPKAEPKKKATKKKTKKAKKGE